MASQIEWSEEDIHQLIIDYKHRPILWNTRIKGADKFKKLSAWKELANIFNTTVSEVQRKTNFLRNTYNNETKKLKKMTPSRKKHFTPWQYYEELRFINDPDSDFSSNDESARSISPPLSTRSAFSRRSVETEKSCPASETISRLSPTSERPIKRRKTTTKAIHVTPCSPTTFLGSPSRFSGSLTVFPGSPSRFSGSPTQYPGSPSRFSGSPTQYPGSPSRFSGSPTQYPGSPSRFSGSPTQYPGSPSRFASTPTKIPDSTSIWNETKTISKKVQEELNETVSECGSVLSFTDQYELFGAFVASEIRNLKRESNRVQLKKMIQKCILQVSEQDSRK